MGYLESAMAGSLVQLAICNETLGWIKNFAADVEISDETLALDLIDAIGPDGSFLDTDHTLHHYRDRWYPTLMERGDYNRWLTHGEKTLAERATEQVIDILAHYEPCPLPKETAEAVHAILEQAKRAHA
jgi:trimethylamine--corrinoid protein Co-methyltransferase